MKFFRRKLHFTVSKKLVLKGAVSKVETVSFFIGYCDKNRKKIFAGMFVFCIFIAVNQ
jgi:hypothetical protein